MPIANVSTIKGGHFLCCRTNLQSQKSRGSMKSVRVPWYQRPFVKNNEYVNIQKGAVFTSLFSLVYFKILTYSLLVHLERSNINGIFLLFFAVRSAIHHCHIAIRYLLFGNGRTRQHSLRLLFHIIRICVCGQSSW